MVNKKTTEAEKLEYRRAVLEVITFSCKDIVTASGTQTDENLWSEKGEGVTEDTDGWWGW